MKRVLLALVLLAGCKKSAGEATPDGYVIRVHLEKRLSPADVDGLVVVLAKKGGFPEFADRRAGEIVVSSADTDGDAAREVVLTWPDGFGFQETQYVRLRFDNQAAMAMSIDGTATGASGGRLAAGTISVTVPAGGEGVADLTLECLESDCSPVAPADAGADTGPSPDGPESDTGPDLDAGVDASVLPEPVPDAGVMPEPPPDLSTADTLARQVGESASAAGTSGAGTLELQHQLGHMIGHGSSSANTADAGPTVVESVLTITR